MTRMLAPAGVLAVAIWAAGAQAADPANGRRLYETHCVTCHGADGRGVMPGVPDFTRPETLMRTDRRLLSAIRDGTGAGPAFFGILSEAEILDVIAYLRTFTQ
ncbi:c-type cytochrome [Inmirania thermothiophila]|uniref:Cytochrome c553 n=1 Tax=Inmirania thermothiophila TaxID=1750597 RepID=A0A3N1Y254_9GAMM|nr:cytochrome c [Inmirania thermothiophila]ROR32904.1 cytochrome c553 [Inmirania thermothiophila]